MDSSNISRLEIGVDADGPFIAVLNTADQDLAVMAEGIGGHGVVSVMPASGGAETAGMGGDGVLFVNTSGGTRVAEMFSIGGNGNGFINLYNAVGAQGIAIGGDGNASKSSGGASWGVLSDERLKDIHGTFDAGIGEVLRLQPIKFRYKKDNLMNLPDYGEHIGFSAQEVQKVLPEAVIENSRGFLQIQSDPILWSMLNAIKEQQAQIEELKDEVKVINEVKSENEQLKENLLALADRQDALEAMILALSTNFQREKLVKLDQVKLSKVQKTIQ